MKREELQKQIEENIHKIRIGDVFSSQKSLYEALGIPDDKNGNKTSKKVVELYIQCGLVREGSRKIKVTAINEHPEYVDGRSKNGGANNVIYAPILKAALIGYEEYPEFITYNTLFEKVYCFQKGYFTSIPAKLNKHVLEYRNHLRGQLRERTKNALESLQKEELLHYHDVYVIDRNQELRVLGGGYLEVDDETLLSDVVSLWCKDKDGDDIFKCFEQLMNQKAKSENDYIELSQLTVVEFADLVFKKKFSADYKKVINQFMSFPEEASFKKATEQQQKFIQKVEEAICNRLGIDRKQMAYDTKAGKRVYKRVEIIYNLFGWKTAFKALEIKDINYCDGVKKYPIGSFSHQALLEKLEPQITKWVISHTRNFYEIEKKKHEGKKRFGREHRIVQTNEEYPYLAHEEKVNYAHCELFGLEKQSDYFLQAIELKKTIPEE